MILRQGCENSFENDNYISVNWNFSEACNYRCRYCFSNGKHNDLLKSVKYRSEAEILSAIDKIIVAGGENKHYKFVFVGGEPTLNPVLPSAVKYIKEKISKCDILIITNFSQKADYYNDLRCPLNVSIHFDHINPTHTINKLIATKEVINSVNLMAHPEKMSVVKKTYEALEKIAIDQKLNVSVSIVRDGSVPSPKYNKEDLKWIVANRGIQGQSSDFYHNLGVQPKKSNLTWVEDINGEIIKRKYNFKEATVKKKLNFINMYCCAGFVLKISHSGLTTQGVCNTNKVTFNIYEEKNIPKTFFEPIICKTETCQCSANIWVPKFRSLEYAPEYNHTHKSNSRNNSINLECITKTTSNTNQIRALKEEIDRLQSTNAILSKQIGDIYESTSWRISAPLRLVKKLFLL